MVFFRLSFPLMVRLNASSQPLTLRPDTKAIGTFFYRAHGVIAFRNFCYGCLQNLGVLKAYKLNPEFPWLRVWHIMTVDVASGRAVLLAQGIMVPRITAFADFAGNYQSLGRFLVFNSRMVLYLTLYVISECLESSELPECWYNVKQIIATEALPAIYQHYEE